MHSVLMPNMYAMFCEAPLSFSLHLESTFLRMVAYRYAWWLRAAARIPDRNLLIINNGKNTLRGELKGDTEIHI